MLVLLSVRVGGLVVWCRCVKVLVSVCVGWWFDSTADDDDYDLDSNPMIRPLHKSEKFPRHTW